METKDKKPQDPITDYQDETVKSDDTENTLAYDEQKKSFELDVDDDDPDYDHPMDYETIAEGAVNDDSSYDSSNPYVGKEYAEKEEIYKEDLDDLGMRVSNADNLRVNMVDRQLSTTEEDFRDDLDAEGYPKNDRKK